MMSVEQEKAVREVYRNFIQHDYDRNWVPIDDRLWELDFLTDEQTILETEVQLYRHSSENGVLKCNENHGDSVCLVPQIIDSVNAICELWQENRVLHPNNRYILQNYLAISHEGLIFLDEEVK